MFLTVAARQRPPRKVRTPRRSSSRATSRCDVTPVERIAAMIGRTRAHQAAAAARCAAIDAAFPFRAAMSARAPFGLPRRRPRAVAAAKAALMRSLMISGSYSATAARTWIASRFADGESAARKSTPLSMRPEMKWTFRASRSSLAMIGVAPVACACASAAASCGRSVFRPLSTSSYSASIPTAGDIGGDGLALRFEPEARDALPLGRHPQIGDKGAIHSNDVADERGYTPVNDVAEQLSLQLATLKTRLRLTAGAAGACSRLGVEGWAGSRDLAHQARCAGCSDLYHSLSCSPCLLPLAKGRAASRRRPGRRGTRPPPRAVQPLRGISPLP
jgi:hypothetical protein